eukprot:998133-Prymnesium_polylepis.1
MCKNVGLCPNYSRNEPSRLTSLPPACTFGPPLHCAQTHPTPHPTAPVLTRTSGQGEHQQIC